MTRKPKLRTPAKMNESALPKYDVPLSSLTYPPLSLQDDDPQDPTIHIVSNHDA